jgi:hypothetical protein
MLTLIVGGSLVAGSDNPHRGTLMPLGPSTPSVGLNTKRASELESQRRFALAPDARKSNFRRTDRQTGFLMPPSVDEWLPQRHLARFVVEVIDGLDLKSMSKIYRGSGSASYHPATLLGLLVPLHSDYDSLAVSG